MTEQRSETTSLAGPESPATRQSGTRSPFVTPIVQHLGGMESLTLAGGTVP